MKKLELFCWFYHMRHEAPDYWDYWPRLWLKIVWNVIGRFHCKASWNYSRTKYLTIVFNAFFRLQGDIDKENKIIYICSILYQFVFVIFEYPSLYRYKEFISIMEINIQASKVTLIYRKNVCAVLRDLVPFLYFNKKEKHSWRVVTFH